MKELGYHEHIISMLGWSKHSEKPCLIFELAQTDLLRYVRTLTPKGEMNDDGIYINENPISIRKFLSILWQVADGGKSFSPYTFFRHAIHRF